MCCINKSTLWTDQNTLLFCFVSCCCNASIRGRMSTCTVTWWLPCLVSSIRLMLLNSRFSRQPWKFPLETAEFWAAPMLIWQQTEDQNKLSASALTVRSCRGVGLIPVRRPRGWTPRGSERPRCVCPRSGSGGRFSAPERRGANADHPAGCRERPAPMARRRESLWKKREKEVFVITEKQPKISRK